MAKPPTHSESTRSHQVKVAWFGTTDKIIGAYRDEAGAVHGVSLTCTHLGCTVR